ncbi:MAG: T9SS type A sorting domain-containing protein [candidate division WOR-3 bacterium]|nr:T9SS type A sorting domain-containing protein [candidate division WOR-3 bacterium]
MKVIVRGLILVLAVLALGRARPALSPFDSNPFLIDTSLVAMPTYYTQTTPRVAFDGTNYLVVWRNDWSGMYYGIVATRLGPDGRVLDLGGITLGDGESPAVAFGGDNYLVVWSLDSAIRCARVSTAGVVLDTPFTVTNVPGAAPAVAFDGVNYLVAWGGHDLYAARVTPGGVVLDPTGILVSGAPGVQESPAIACDGANCLITWQDMRPGGYLDICGARVTPSGGVLDPGGIAISTATYSQWYPVVAFDGTNYLVAWQDYRTTDFDLYASRVTPAGTVLDPAGLPIATSAIYQRYPSLTFGNSSYFLTWERWDSAGCSGVWGARIETSGVPRDTGFSVAPAAQRHAPVIYGDNRYFTAWEQDGIRATWVDTSGNIQNPSGSPVYAIANEQRQPGAAFNGTDYLVVWQDERPGDTADIRGIRISQSGAQVDPLPFTISAAGKTQGNPAVASNGSDWLVTWSDLRNDTADIYAARVSQGGVVLDTAGIRICTADGSQTLPAVAYNGADYLVVWQDGRPGYVAIYAARVTSAGFVLDPDGFRVCSSEYSQEFPSLSFDGTNCLVVWADSRAGRDIFGARIDANGYVLDPTGFMISPDTLPELCPTVTYCGDRYFVAWMGIPRRIGGAFVSPAGVVLDRIESVWNQGITQNYPTTAFDGTNVSVAWENASGVDIYGATIDLSGNRLDTFALAATSGKEYGPKLAAGAPGQLLAVYCGWVDTAAGRAWRCRRILGKLTPFAGLAEERTELRAQLLKLDAVPNPFRSALTLTLSHWEREGVRVRIYDAQGRLIRTFPLSSLLSPPSSLCWDATDSRGRPVPAGIYFITAESGGTRQTRAVTLVRN